MDRKKIRAYFRRSWTGFPVLSLAIALVAFIVGANAANFALVALSLVLTGLSITVFVLPNFKLSDEELDQIIAEEVERLPPRAMQRSQLTADDLVPPGSTITVWGPHFDNVPNTIRFSRQGKDKIWRSSALNVAVLNFTEHQLVGYITILDLLTGNPLQETTHEYFYRDVVGVIVQSKNQAVSLGKEQTISQAIERNQLSQERVAEVFQLTTTGGTAISFEIPARSRIQEGGTIVDERIQSLRRLLREKKLSVPGAS